MMTNIRSGIYPELQTLKSDISQFVTRLNPKQEKEIVWKTAYSQIHPQLQCCLSEIERLLMFRKSQEYYRLTLLSVTKRIQSIITQISNYPVLETIVEKLKEYYQIFLDLLPQEENAFQLELFTPEQVVSQDPKPLIFPQVKDCLDHWNQTVREEHHPLDDFGLPHVRGRLIKVTRYEDYLERVRSSNQFPAPPQGVQRVIDFTNPFLESIREKVSRLTLRAARKVAKALCLPQKVQGKDRKLAEFRQAFNHLATLQPHRISTVF